MNPVLNVANFFASILQAIPYSVRMLFLLSMTLCTIAFLVHLVVKLTS